MFENQHLVTEAILRRWTDGATKLLDVYQIDTGLTSTKSPREVCAVENFIHDDPAKAERLWSKHETRPRCLRFGPDEETFFEILARFERLVRCWLYTPCEAIQAAQCRPEPARRRRRPLTS